MPPRPRRRRGGYKARLVGQDDRLDPVSQPEAATLLSAAGGSAGAVIGLAVTLGVARSHAWAFSVPAVAVRGCLGVAVAAGALAGCYPALRAARMSPAEALGTG